MKHELNILDNAISSLREALIKFEEGSDKNLSAYKFAILHFSHFFELLFKHYVTLSHPLLLYKNPFSKNIVKENTIGLWEAVQFLKNEGKLISPDFITDLEWIKKLRNDIEHSKFELDVIEVRDYLGRLIRATDEFNDEHALIDITTKLGGNHLAIYQQLGNEYKAKLATARVAAKANIQGEDEIYSCSICGESDVAVKIGSELQCMFCSETEPLRECCHCSQQYKENEVRVWNNEAANNVDYMCDYCYDYIMSRD